MSAIADQLRQMASDLESVPRHHLGSPLYEKMYEIMSTNRHKISYQLDDLACNADVVREWLAEAEALMEDDDEGDER